MTHTYKLTMQWTGNLGSGTTDYRSYERSHLFSAPGKPDLLGSSDPSFRGDVSKWNPEELLLAALSSCHMLWYLHLCSTKKIVVIEYVDESVAELKVESNGEGNFTSAVLHPKILITDEAQVEEARMLHKPAHEKCFIARSLNFPIKIEPVIKAE